MTDVTVSQDWKSKYEAKSKRCQQNMQKYRKLNATNKRRRREICCKNQPQKDLCVHSKSQPNWSLVGEWVGGVLAAALPWCCWGCPLQALCYAGPRSRERQSPWTCPWPCHAPSWCWQSHHTCVPAKTNTLSNTSLQTLPEMVKCHWRGCPLFLHSCLLMLPAPSKRFGH